MLGTSRLIMASHSVSQFGPDAVALIPTPTPTVTTRVTVVIEPTATPPAPMPQPAPPDSPLVPTVRQPVRVFAVRPPTPAGSPSVGPSAEPDSLPTSEGPLPTPRWETADGQLITSPESARPDLNLEQVGVLPTFGLSGLALEGVYTVQEGDTLWRVAIEMGLDLEEAICAVAPDFSLDQPLIVGMELHAPPLGTVCHRVEPGETSAAIARHYGVDPGALGREPWNQLDSAGAEQVLPAGRYVRVPGAVLASAPVGETDSFLAYMLAQPVNLSPYVAVAAGGPRRVAPAEPVPANWPYGSGVFEWPVYGWLSNGYRQDHRAIDIAAQPGTFVTAADRGVVVRAGWNSQGYGRFVVIDHNIDYVTLYAHLDQVLVAEGDVVGKGQVLGTVGSTGNSTGPHLHFEIRDFGRRANPIEYLVR